MAQKLALSLLLGEGRLRLFVVVAVGIGACAHG